MFSKASIMIDNPIESCSVLSLVAPMLANMPPSTMVPPMSPHSIISSLLHVDSRPLARHSITASLTRLAYIFNGLNYGLWAFTFENFLQTHYILHHLTSPQPYMMSPTD